MRSSTEDLISALRILAEDIQSGDGVANACIAEAASRMEEQRTEINNQREIIKHLQEGKHE